MRDEHARRAEKIVEAHNRARPLEQIGARELATRCGVQLEAQLCATTLAAPALSEEHIEEFRCEVAARHRAVA